MFTSVCPSPFKPLLPGSRSALDRTWSSSILFCQNVCFLLDSIQTEEDGRKKKRLVPNLKKKTKQTQQTTKSVKRERKKNLNASVYT